MTAPVRTGPSEPEPLEESVGVPAPPDFGVWDLAWPTMALYGLHALVGVVDFAFVSSLGSEAVAAVGVAMQIHFVVFALLAAVTTGTVAIVSREAGAGRWREVVRATRASVALAALLGVSLSALAPFSRDAVSMLGVAGRVADQGGACLAILLCFNAPFAVELALSMALRGMGDVRTPLWIGVFANALNGVLCYALVYGRLGAPALGTLGSALASAIAFSTSAGVLVALWWTERLAVPRRVVGRSLTRAMTWRLLRIGLPTALEQVAFQIGLLVFLSIIALYGTPAVSAYLIGVRILSMCFVPGLGFATAAATLVGQHLGAQRPERAVRLGWRAAALAIVVMGAVGLSIGLAAARLARIFGAAGSETLELSVVFIHILGTAQPLMAIEFALGGALRGAGDTRFPLFAILTGLFVFRLGGAILIARPVFDTVTAVWSCLLADYAVKAALLSLRFASGRWRSVRV